MLDGWLNAIVHCEECYATWTEALPPSWDGTPPMCKFCGEECSCEVAEGVAKGGKQKEA